MDRELGRFPAAARREPSAGRARTYGREFEYELDVYCPACEEDSGVWEATDGDEYECLSCGIPMQAVAKAGGIMHFELADISDPDLVPVDDEDGD